MIRQPTNNKPSQKGTTLVELLIASAILGIALAGAAAGLSSFGDVKFKTIGSKAKNDISASVIQNIQSSVAKYQMNFADTGASQNQVFETDRVLAIDNLSFAWSNNFIGGADECPDCPGRYGYVIQPIEGFRHLYKVTIRMTNPDIFSGHKDYVFITGNK